MTVQLAFTDDLVDHLRLLRSRRVGVATYHRLLKQHGTARAALDALPEIARQAGVEDYHPCPEGVVLAELKAGRAAKARLVAQSDAGYPESLRSVDGAPPLFWALGDTALLARPMVALVGARNASSLGLRTARKLAGDLVDAGFVVVSGLARGVDTAAHLAALDGGTIAVMAGGVDIIYPAENTALAHDIAAKGLRLSEMPMGLQPQARHFPQRNRIISALSQGVLVVEAAAKSGSLITARTALDQGRDVMAVPGHPFDARAAGCNMLIRDGASLVRSADDVIGVLGDPQSVDRPVSVPAPAATPKPKRSLRETAALYDQILSRLGPSPLAEDQLIRDLRVTAKQVAPVLVDLELDGRIDRQAGGLLALRTAN